MSRKRSLPDENGTCAVKITRWAEGALGQPAADRVATEAPLEIRVEGRTLAVVMRTPGDDLELAAGFLLSEGIIKSAKDLFDLTTCLEAEAEGKGAAVDAALRRPEALDLEKLTRHVLTSASCGVCSKAVLDLTVRRRLAPGSWRLEAEVLLRMPEQLAKAQTTFLRTGGLHACGIFTPAGELLAMREDVGRHNALDKVIGWAVRGRLNPLRRHVLFLSGRVSFEMMQKAHAAAIPVVAAISAPTSLAVEFARRSGQTLAGFIRGGNMNVYAHPARIVAAERAGVLSEIEVEAAESKPR